MRPELLPVVRAMSLRREPLGDLDACVGRVGNVEVVATMTGIGMEPATLATKRLLAATRVDHVVVVGIAGGVLPNVALGDLVVPEVVVDRRTEKEYRPARLDDFRQRGIILSGDQLLTYRDREEIERLAGRGVFALDMETGAVASVCAERGVPWSVFRGISDIAGDPVIDDSLVGLSRPDGTANLPAVLRYLLVHPLRVRHLGRLARSMRAAADAAAAAAKQAFERQ
jgi:adenosylhomocysteine nucleosidase